jgi:hypothetical protein
VGIDPMLGYCEAPRRAMSTRRKVLRALAARAPSLAAGLVGVLVGAVMVLVLSGPAFDLTRMIFTALLAGLIFALVQRRLTGE